MEQTFDPHADSKIRDAVKDIPGWGIDANPQNNPTYPMKHTTGADHQRIHYERPPQQPEDIEVFVSIERPGVTSVFGTSAPPSGLSGAIRRFAYQSSESTYAHWVPLVVADRVDMVQGMIDDLRRGIVPNIFAMRGLKAEWKYNRPGLIKKIALGVAVTTVVFMIASRKKKHWLS